MQTLEFTGRAVRHRAPLDRGGFAAATERHGETPKTVTSKASQDALNETLQNLLNPSSSFKDYEPRGVQARQGHRKSTFKRRNDRRGGSIVERDSASPGSARFLGFAHNASSEASPNAHGSSSS